MSDTQKHTKPNVPNLRFPGFEGEWEKRRIGDIGKLFSGGTPSSSRKDFYGGEIPFIRSGEIHSDKTELFLTQEGYMNSSAKMVERGDILLALYGANSGDISISQMRGAINQAILCIKTNVAPVFLKSVWEKHALKILNTYLQGGQGNLSADIVKKITISIPSRPEQAKIAALFSLIDERIAVQNKVIEDLMKLKAALCTSLFSQGRTISVALSDIGESFSTMNLSKEDLTDSGTECILYGELFTTYGRVIKDVKSHTSIETTDEVTTSGFNDLLFPASTTVDAISLIAPAAISKPGVILGGDMFGIRLNAKYNNRYMSNLLYHCYRRELASYAQGSTIIHLHYRDIKRIRITVHPKNIQDCIADTLDLLDFRIANEQKMAATYVCQKAYLIGRLFI